MSLDLHPLCTLFPRLSGAEFDALRDDIKANGLRHPIVLHEGMILDGGNRYRACIEAGVEPEFAPFEGGNLVSFVLSANLHRRHMTPGQQAAIVASAQDWAMSQVAGSNQHVTRGPATLPDHKGATLPDRLSTVAERAAQSGASERTQRMADKVAKADPELAKKVAQGAVSLPKAVETIAGKRKTEQEQADEDAFGDFDPIEELKTTQAEIERLQAQIKALSADDVKAELARQITIRQGIEARLAQEMNKSNALDKQLRKLGKTLETLRKLTGAQTNSEVVEAVRAMTKKAA